MITFLYRIIGEIINKDISQSVSKPHTKEYLTTPLGRFIENISYLKLMIVTCTAWILSSIYFSVATYFGHGMNIKVACFEKFEVILTSMYFSGVTLTTLGYGDISPLGVGRLIAVLLAISGLTIIAVLIAKISSERQSTLLLLLHTSDVERRMSEFTNQIESISIEIKNNTSNYSVDELRKKLKEQRATIEIANRYMIFHINQSMFLEIGTETSIKKFMIQLSGFHDVLMELLKVASVNPNIQESIYGLSRKMFNIESMLISQNKAKGTQIETINVGSLNKKHQDFYSWQRTTQTKLMVNNVKKLLPDGPRENWPKDLNKQISKELDISIKMAGKVVKEINKTRVN